MQRTGRQRIGDILLSAEVITEEQLKQALQVQKDKGIQLGKALVQLGITTQEAIMSALSEQLEIPEINLQAYHVDKTVLEYVSEKFARDKKVIPLFQPVKIDVGMGTKMLYYAKGFFDFFDTHSSFACKVLKKFLASLGWSIFPGRKE